MAAIGFRAFAGGLAAAALWLGGPPPAAAHDIAGEVPRTAVVSAFPPELSVLAEGLEEAVVHSANGVDFTLGRLAGRDVVLFLSGISVVNAAMTVQLALSTARSSRAESAGAPTSCRCAGPARGGGRACPRRPEPARG